MESACIIHLQQTPELTLSMGSTLKMHNISRLYLGIGWNTVDIFSIHDLPSDLFKGHCKNMLPLPWCTVMTNCNKMVPTPIKNKH